MRPPRSPNDYSDLPDGCELIYGGGADGSEAIGCTTPDGKVYWFENAPFPSTPEELAELFGGNAETPAEPAWNVEDPVATDDNTGFTDEDLALVTSFKDVKTTAWYYNDVTECAKLGIVAGFEDGSFRPENHVTDVQWVTMVTRTFYNSDVETAQRSKPSGTPWYWANIKVGEDKYLCGTYGGVTISDKAMNRYDMARVTSNVVNTINGGAARPSDAAMDKVPSQVKDWSNVPKNRIMAIETCYATGLIAGMSDGKFHGEQSMTRARACTVIMRMLKLINKYNPGDKDNSQYDDGKDQNTGNNNQQTQTGKLANGQEATVANVQAILDQIKREYPEGTIWGNSNTPGTNYYKNGPAGYDKNRDVSAGIAGLRHFTFHALRHTFASRAMEQGMDAKTLSILLGHASVSFTMDTYAHVLTDHKRESMALMEDLYALDQTPLQEVSYSVIVTTQPDGSMQFDVPDFPEVKYSGLDMPQALQYIKERLQEEKLISIFPPAPTPSNQIVLQSGQFLLQIPV